MSSSNYTFTFVSETLTVAPAPLTVTAETATRVYGAPAPAMVYTITGCVNGDTVAALVTGAPSLDTPTSPVGTYPLTPGLGTLKADNNYTFAFVSAMLTVNPATLTITASNASKVYGAADPTLTYTISGYINNETATTGGVTGTPSLTTTATASSSVGSYPITVTPGTLQAANYTFAVSTLTAPALTVTAAVLTVTANGYSRAYGAADPASWPYTITGFVNGDVFEQSELKVPPTFSSTDTGSSSLVGNYTISQSGSQALIYSDANYVIDQTFNPGILTITPAPLTIALNMPSYLTRSYGAANPSLNLPLDDFSYTGFVNGDNQDDALTGTPSVSTVATMTSPVGSYPITINAGSLSSPNYTFTFESETLTVVPAVLTVTSVTATRSYGTTTANTQFYTIIGFANGQVLATSDVTGTPGIATTTTATSSVGTYPGTPALGTLKSTNYTFAFAPEPGRCRSRRRSLPFRPTTSVASTVSPILI